MRFFKNAIFLIAFTDFKILFYNEQLNCIQLQRIHWLILQEKRQRSR